MGLTPPHLPPPPRPLRRCSAPAPRQVPPSRLSEEQALMQPAAAGFAIIMLGAIRLKAAQMHRGFSVDGGWELDFVLLTAALALIFLGAGAISFDRLLFGL